VSILTFHYSESLRSLWSNSFGVGILPLDPADSDRFFGDDIPDLIDGLPSFGLGLRDAPKLPASFDDDELAPLPFVDVVADEPHPNAVWNVGHVDGLDGFESSFNPEWSAENRRAYANGHRSGTLNRTSEAKAVAARAARARHTIDEAFRAGYDAALVDAMPSPPAAYSDDAKGSWFVGFSEASQILIAREHDHLAEQAERAREMDALEGLSNWGGW
jgi:hypothetical protein